jgi:hypothetical protein
MLRVTFIAWVFLKIVGLSCGLAAFALYEHEEQRIQDSVKKWETAIAGYRDSALSLSAAFIREVARLIGVVIDRIFGFKFISFQIIGMSFYFSLASLNLLSIISLKDHALQLSKPFPFQAIFTSLRYIGAALVPAVVSFSISILKNAHPKLRLAYRFALLCWYFGFIWMLLVFLNLSNFVYHKGYISPLLRLSFFFGIAFAVSCIVDILYIGLIRWLVKRISSATTTTHVFHAVLALVACLALVLAPLIVPFGLGLTMLRYVHGLDPKGIALAGIAIIFSSFLNLINLLIGTIGFLLAALIVLHRFFWPALQRIIYAFQRYSVITNKKLLWKICIMLLLLPQPATLWNFWELLLKTLEKL